ncbi:MAG TPA: hypothetical protein VJV75_10630 [Candidatus Polarisedimenticolia bacterium]|nr:hypothetical protein [Candidatus Polarisedimenticolia bacterium]
MKPATTVAAALLSIVSILQLVRVLFRVPVMIGGTGIPVWASGVACVVASGLAAALWREARPGR